MNTENGVSAQVKEELQIKRMRQQAIYRLSDCPEDLKSHNLEIIRRCDKYLASRKDDSMTAQLSRKIRQANGR